MSGGPSRAPSRLAAMSSTSVRACMCRTHSTAVREVAIVGRMTQVISVGLLALCLAGCSKDEPRASPEPAPVIGTGAVASAPTSVGSVAQGRAAPADSPGEHPLKAWMKANTALAMDAKDFEGLATALEKIAGFAPPGYPFWSSIARDGVDAARAQDIDAVRAACRGCHSQYRDRYKRELRER